MGAKRKLADIEEADHRITSEVNDKRDTRAVRLLGALSEIGDQPPMRALCAATVALAIARRDRRLAETGVAMLVAHSLATWAKGEIKAGLDRRRPDSGDDPRIRPGDSERHEDNSFPCGHSAGAVAVGEAFARPYPRHKAAARRAALSVAAVQVPRGKHYVGDVLVGIAIGLLSERMSNIAADVVRRWLHKHRRPVPAA